MVSVLMGEGREAVLGRFAAASCIASTRVAVELLRSYGVRAGALCVEALVFNPAMAAAVAAGAPEPRCRAEMAVRQRRDGWHSIGIGLEDPGSPVWSGHVVCVVGGRGVLDLSLDQAIRPQHGIWTRPAWFEAEREFLAGGCEAAIEQAGSVIRYRARPHDRAFLHAPDWRELSRVRPILRQLEARLR